MESDEELIRDLATTWMRASQTGDTAKILSLMTEDAVFLLPGRAPMRKHEFGQLQRAQSTAQAPTMDGQSEVQEIQIMGDWAFMWTRLRVVVTPADGSRATIRAGDTLSILKKHEGRWLLARDANLLTRVVDRQSP